MNHFKNKYFVFIIILLSISTVRLKAQIHLGIQGGLNISSNYYSKEYMRPFVLDKNGFTIGAIINYEMNRIFSLQAEPRYIQRGKKINYLPDFILINSLDYLEMPVLVVAELPDCNLKPILLLGINVGYLLKATEDYENGFTNPTNNVIDDYKKMNFTLEGGIGFKYYLDNNISLILSGQYSYGIYNIKKNLSPQRIRGIQVLISTLYNL